MVTTRSQSTAASVMQVLQTAELLEAILLEVGEGDLKTLLLSERVNTTFRDTIKSSIKLQRALWFQPPAEVDTKEEAKVNPFFFRDGGSAYRDHVIERCVFFSVRHHSLDVWAITLNEELFDLGLPKGSWRKMMLASQRFVGFVTYYGQGSSYEFIRHVDYQPGATVESVIDYLGSEVQDLIALQKMIASKRAKANQVTGIPSDCA